MTTFACSDQAVHFLPRLAKHFRKLNEPFYTRPESRLVRGVLLAGGVFYVLFLLCLVSGPSKWRWPLAFCHSTRLLKVLVALCGQGQGMADATIELADRVPDAARW